VTGLIYLNNLLAFTYFRSVLQTKSLYGPVSIIPILMMGLFVFWLFVLVGGQVSYALQNVRVRNSQAAWGQLSEAARERLALAVLVSICRRFLDCLPPLSASELALHLKVPTQIINECLNRLIDCGLVNPVPPGDGGIPGDFRYTPSRPPSRITLGEFRRLEETHPEDAAIVAHLHHDPLLRLYDRQHQSSLASEFHTTPLDKLMEQAAETASE
jgi:membrane protein